MGGRKAEEDRTRDEEPGREMEGDTVMTVNTRDNSNQKEPSSFKKLCLFRRLQFRFIENKRRVVMTKCRGVTVTSRMGLSG